jgi:hypothetical protein
MSDHSATLVGYKEYCNRGNNGGGVGATGEGKPPSYELIHVNLLLEFVSLAERKSPFLISFSHFFLFPFLPYISSGH